jgi:aminoglycoside phosphotransferase (APT) family kinase protein
VCAGRMHADEVETDPSLVRRLLAAQFPRWADLPITPVASAGTDNAIYRLGDDMAVRLPRLSRAVEMLEKEQRWLPRLASLLPLAVPTPLADSGPDDEFPYPWSVYRWLDGDNLVEQPDVDMDDLSVRLGQFVAAFHRMDPTGAPPSPRSGSLCSPAQDERVRGQIQDLAADGVLDADVATSAWQAARAAPAWDGPSVCVHADLIPMNLLTRRRRLVAVIDFGLFGLGDPALDMQPAWNMLTAESREVFRTHADVDDATWARGRAWALRLGLGAMHYYRMTNPLLAADGRRAVAEILAESWRDV